MAIAVVNPNYALAAAFRSHFDYLPHVEVANCGFEQLLSYDCLVSPANSFGMVDGGVDAAIAKFFGISLMERGTSLRPLSLSTQVPQLLRSCIQTASDLGG